jgi:histone deacetylase 11
LTPAFVYSPRYDISMYGLERLHPFDGRKYSRAWKLVSSRLGEEAKRYWHEPKFAAQSEDLLRVHTPEHLASLASPATVARALELPLLRLLPARVIERRVLAPMRLAVAGTIEAASLALQPGGAIALNFGGGYHHAFRDHGEGFCIYADVAIAIAVQRARGALGAQDAVAVIDLDAHRGNGFWDIMHDDPAVRVLDLYNFQNYPGLFPGDPAQFPFQIPLKANTQDANYLPLVREELPAFLDGGPRPRLAVYNAGTDIVAGDRIGGLAVSPEGVAERDRLVMSALAERNIPTVIVTSGGYNARSYGLIAQMALAIVETLVA